MVCLQQAIAVAESAGAEELEGLGDGGPAVVVVEEQWMQKPEQEQATSRGPLQIEEGIQWVQGDLALGQYWWAAGICTATTTANTYSVFSRQRCRG